LAGFIGFGKSGKETWLPLELGEIKSLGGPVAWLVASEFSLSPDVDKSLGEIWPS